MQRGLANLSLVVLVGVIIMPVLAIAPSPQPVDAAEGFASPAFRTLWTRTDLPVEDLSVKRSWLWGPQPLNALQEPYSDSPGGQRQVQYFDKSRMEINNPAANAVTNGLLATELIKGELQVGDTPREKRESALVNVAGDSDDLDGPVYASLTGLLGQSAAPVGSTLIETLNRDGSTGTDPSKASFGVTAVNLVSETNHSVASVFWDYLQTTGPVVVGNARRDEKLFEPWYAAVGLPISRAYWAKVKVANKVQDVLIQAFQRRVLTFTPANPDGFKVEMGNIGRHYYIWRYGEEPTPAGPGTPVTDFVPLSGPHIGYGFNGFFQFTPVSDPNQVASLRRSLDLVKEADFSWIRKQIVWATLEPFPGQYDVEQLAAYDAIVREAAERKIGIMFSVAKAPRWAVPGDEFCHDGGGVKLCGLPRDPQVLARLMGFLANRYKDGSEFGRVRAWEVWNEQNTGGETGNNVDVGVYVEALKASYRTIKNADSKAIVVFGGLTPTGVNDKRLAIDDVTYLEQVYQYNNGEVKRYFDVMGAHPGSNNNPPDAFLPNNPGPGTGREGTPCHAERSCWKNHPSFYFRRIEQVRAVMEKYGDAQYGNRLKQIWLTEFGWSTKNDAPGYEYGDVISEELQAQYIVRAFEKGQKDYPWMGVMFLWTLNHSVVVPPSDEKYPWSVIRGDWSPRPAYEAVKNMPKP